MHRPPRIIDEIGPGRVSRAEVIRSIGERCNKDAYCFRPMGHFGGCTPEPTPVSTEGEPDAS